MFHSKIKVAVYWAGAYARHRPHLSSKAMLEGLYYYPHITYGERRIQWQLVTVTQLLRSRGRRLWLPSSGFPTTADSQPQRSNSPTRHHNPTMFLHQKWSLSLTSTEIFSCLYPRAPRAPSQIPLNTSTSSGTLATAALSSTQLNKFHRFLQSLTFSSHCLLQQILIESVTVPDNGNAAVMRHGFPVLWSCHSNGVGGDRHYGTKS